ncbi:unnamed protein product [Rotaria sp. Silwood2]|nr:unnamed protein product [Rotaria sp. Silwood2]
MNAVVGLSKQQQQNQYIANVNLQYSKCSGIGRRVNSNWLGTFIVGDSCVQAECCYLVEQVKISKLNDTQLLVSANVAGAACGPQEIKSIPTEIPIPIPKDKHGFQLTTFFVGSTNRFTLTYDNQYIANGNLQVPGCTGMDHRVSDKMDINTLKLLFFTYKGKYHNNYDKLILTAHWSLINFGFVVEDKNEEENILFTFHRDTHNVVTIKYIYNGHNVHTEHFFEDGMIKFYNTGIKKTFAIKHDDFMNQQHTDVEMTKLSCLNTKLRLRLYQILCEVGLH